MSQLYESFTLLNSRTHSGAATANPKRRPARLYDLLSVRVTITFGSRRVNSSALDSAKSAYASSTTSGPFNCPANRSSAALATTVPDGEFGLATSVRFAPGIGHGS